MRFALGMQSKTLVDLKGFAAVFTLFRSMAILAGKEPS